MYRTYCVCGITGNIVPRIGVNGDNTGVSGDGISISLMPPATPALLSPVTPITPPIPQPATSVPLPTPLPLLTLSPLVTPLSQDLGKFVNALGTSNMAVHISARSCFVLFSRSVLRSCLRGESVSYESIVW